MVKIVFIEINISRQYNDNIFFNYKLNDSRVFLYEHYLLIIKSLKMKCNY